jgi:hypothetical protein
LFFSVVFMFVNHLIPPLNKSMFSSLIHVAVLPLQPVIHGILHCLVIATVVSLQFFFKRPWISSMLGMFCGGFGLNIIASFEHPLTICDREPFLQCHTGYSGSFFPSLCVQLSEFVLPNKSRFGKAKLSHNCHYAAYTGEWGECL